MRNPFTLRLWVGAAMLVSDAHAIGVDGNVIYKRRDSCLGNWGLTTGLKPGFNCWQRRPVFAFNGWPAGRYDPSLNNSAYIPGDGKIYTDACKNTRLNN